MEATDILQTKIYLMTNWEKEVWTRIYGKVTKGPKFIYTFSREDASLQKYPHSLSGIDSVLLKLP